MKEKGLLEANAGWQAQLLCHDIITVGRAACSQTTAPGDKHGHCESCRPSSL